MYAGIYGVEKYFSNFSIGVRDRGAGGGGDFWKPWKKVLGKIKKIRADL
jgi:hypothetical protein